MDDSHIGRFLDTAADSVRNQIPGLHEVLVWRGRVGESVIDKISMRTPAVVIACDRADVAPLSSPLALQLTLVALCVARGGEERGRVALGLVEGLARWLDAWEWGAGLDARPPERITARNLWTRGVDQKGIAIWALAWSQQLALPPLAPGEPWVPATLWLDDGGATSVEVDLPPAGAQAIEAA